MLSKTTEVLLYETQCLEDMNDEDFKSAVHHREPAFILLYTLPWPEYVDTATCVNCAARSLHQITSLRINGFMKLLFESPDLTGITQPCKFGTLNLDNNPKIRQRYNITQANRIMLFKNNRMYCLPMHDLSITAFEGFLTEGHETSVSISLPTKYTMRQICLNLCADLVGVWCDHVGTFLVVMAFVAIIVVALFIILTSNKSGVTVAYAPTMDP